MSNSDAYVGWVIYSSSGIIIDIDHDPQVVPNSSEVVMTDRWITAYAMPHNGTTLSPLPSLLLFCLLIYSFHLSS